jgi:hypothetical protein
MVPLVSFGVFQLEVAEGLQQAGPQQVGQLVELVEEVQRNQDLQLVAAQVTTVQ